MPRRARRARGDPPRSWRSPRPPSEPSAASLEPVGRSPPSNVWRARLTLTAVAPLARLGWPLAAVCAAAAALAAAVLALAVRAGVAGRASSSCGRCSAAPVGPARARGRRPQDRDRPRDHVLAATRCRSCRRATTTSSGSSARGDRPGRRNRISAGTFHPDQEGRSTRAIRRRGRSGPVYPVLSVTAEPGDGDPRPTGPEVLRSRP